MRNETAAPVTNASKNVSSSPDVTKAAAPVAKTAPKTVPVQKAAAKEDKPTAVNQTAVAGAAVATNKTNVVTNRTAVANSTKSKAVAMARMTTTVSLRRAPRAAAA